MQLPVGLPFIMTKTKLTPKDHFGNVIEVGDKYFYGGSTVTGVIHAVKRTTIELQLGDEYNDNIMKCKSPDKGICLDKIPNDAADTVYKVTWRVWKGIEPCGVAEYESFQQSFTDLAAALLLFEVKSLYHDRAKLTKITTELLEESDD